NTLRRARNRLAFLVRAREALGHPIEVVSGREEARLVYLGVAHSVADPVADARRLVVDIGGGSTEVIIGENLVPLAAESLHMGCVSYSLRFFPRRRLTDDRFRKATIAARLEMEPHKKRFRSLGWERALGSSGTIKAIGAIFEAQGWGTRITRKGLDRLRQQLVAAGTVDALAVPGLAEDRREVIAGGLAVLQGVMRGLRLDAIEAATGSIRDGALLDMFRREHSLDARDATVLDLATRWGVDTLQAARVERTARQLLAAVAEPWRLDDRELAKSLSWAARLHELGLAVAHPSYHKHGAYILAHADMPGFSREGQQVLSLLVASHRRKLRPELFEVLTPDLRPRVLRLSLLLRIAVRLHRSRSDRPLPPIAATAPSRRRLSLRFPAGWLAEHPLTAADLDRERQYQAQVGRELDIGEDRPSPQA
ncbi:MAG: Ppx/GppA family phosphatase, partial [Deltaproteobacteria bacterium]